MNSRQQRVLSSVCLFQRWPQLGSPSGPAQAGSHLVEIRADGERRLKLLLLLRCQCGGSVSSWGGAAWDLQYRRKVTGGAFSLSPAHSYVVPLHGKSTRRPGNHNSIKGGSDYYSV